MTQFVGVDIGLDGGLAMLNAEGNPLHLQRIPVIALKTGHKVRHEYDIPAIVQALRDVSKQNGLLVTLERLWSRPGQSSASMFSLGKGVGVWLGVLTALGIRYELVTPQSWKASLLAGTAKDKGASVIKAHQLFPSAAAQIGRHHGLSDSILLAEYGRRIYQHG